MAKIIKPWLKSNSAIAKINNFDTDTASYQTDGKKEQSAKRGIPLQGGGAMLTMTIDPVTKNE